MEKEIKEQRNILNVTEEKQKKKVTLKLLFKLFYTSFYISAVAFGGGFIVISLLQSVFVKKLKMIKEADMLDFYALAQASPGAIALNTAMLVGFNVAGILGALVTVIASVIPPFAVITGLYFFYDAIKEIELVSLFMKGMQAGVVGVIFSMVFDMCKGVIKGKNAFEITVLILAFTVSFLSGFLFNISTVIYVVVLSAALGVGASYISYFHTKRKAGKE